MTLRRATDADIPVIRSLAEKIWWEHYPSIISEDQVAYMLELIYSETALRRQMLEEEQVFWLAEENGIPFGFLGITLKDEGEYFLNKFYLDTRDKGWGLVIFEKILAQYPDLKVLRLRVNRRNFKSVNFYFKVGFRIEFCIDTPFGEGFVMDDFQMIYTR